MTKIRLASLILLALFVTGCTPIVANPVVEMTPSTGLVREPIAKPVIMAWNSVYSGVTSGKVTINNLHRGSVVDSWISDTVMDTGLVYLKGSPLCFTIYNGSDQERSYSVTFDEGKYGQPDGYTSWAEIADTNPKVPAKSSMSIPVRITIPDNADNIPNQWEFRLIVVPEGQGNIQYASAVRFLINMR